MKKIYLYAAHTPFSPGGMCNCRTEHEDVLRFAQLLSHSLRRAGFEEVSLLRGNIRECEDKDAVVLIFHRDYNEGNSFSHGARVYVPDSAGCETQYEAYRLLESLSRFGGFRYKGVHFPISRKGFCSLEKTGCEKTFLFTLGYIDSARDNKIFDERTALLSDELCEELCDILKEKKYEY